MDKGLMAPCGMNCGICRAYLRDKYKSSCEKYPCARLKQLDKRYRTKYAMSMIGNLNRIKEIGIDRFMIDENRRWVCEKCGDVICVHNKKCYKCGFQR